MNIQNKYEDVLNMLANEADTNKYKLVYEKDGEIYCSTTGVPTEYDFCVTLQPTDVEAAADTEVEIDAIAPIETTEELPAVLETAEEVTTESTSKRKGRANAAEKITAVKPEAVETEDN